MRQLTDRDVNAIGACESNSGHFDDLCSKKIVI